MSERQGGLPKNLRAASLLNLLHRKSHTRLHGSPRLVDTLRCFLKIC